ncbi:MAG: T9SS type A sorting domain-containing protein [Bacteroidales bacterium]
MVKTTTSLIFILLLPVLLVAQVQRLLLVEEFTNASCNPCAVQNPGFDALLSNNSGKVVTVKYHVNWPGTDLFNLQNPNDPKTRAKYYNITGVPFAKIDGLTLTGQNYSGAPANLTQEKIDALSSVPSPFSLTVSHSKSANNDSLYVTLKIKAYQTVSGNLSAHIAIEEKTIEFPQSPGLNGEKVFNSVLRKMLPDAYGTQLPYSFNSLDSLILEESWAIKDIFDPDLICVVAWIQDNYTKEIHQTAYDAPRGPDLVNVSPVSIDQPGSISCGNLITPKTTIRNMGGIPVTSVEINYSINNNNFQTYVWTGHLNYLDQTTVSLPSIAFNPLAQNNNIVVFTHNPNGSLDSIPGNDTIQKVFQPAYTAGTPVTIEIRTDQYPSETTWKLINSARNIVASGGPYTQANTIETRTINFLNGECYEFIINDQFGDGICCNYGNGFYKLKDHNGVVFAQGGSFGQEEVTPFMVDINLGVPEPELSCDFQVFPNPFDNTATISLYLPRDMNVTLMVMNEVGQFVYMKDKVLLKSGNHTFDLNGETWTPGIYFVKIFAGDKLITRKLSLTK